MISSYSLQSIIERQGGKELKMEETKVETTKEWLLTALIPYLLSYLSYVTQAFPYQSAIQTMTTDPSDEGNFSIKIPYFQICQNVCQVDKSYNNYMSNVRQSFLNKYICSNSGNIECWGDDSVGKELAHTSIMTWVQILVT